MGKTVRKVKNEIQVLTSSSSFTLGNESAPSGTWMLYAEYLKKGYEAYRTRKGENIFGEVLWTDTYLVWTERGKEFIHGLFNEIAA